jgi:hypothetical protein
MVQMSCGLLPQRDLIVNVAGIMECSEIAQQCIDDFQYAKASGDLMQLNFVTAQCSTKWLNAGCQQIIADTISAIGAK